jgi:hypothetical protein
MKSSRDMYKAKRNEGEGKGQRRKGMEEKRDMNDRGIYGMPRFSPRKVGSGLPTTARRTWINTH